MAYEQLYTQQGQVYIAVYVDVFKDDQWLNLGHVDLLPQEGTSSSLDLDIANGYIYVAYSKRELEAGDNRYSIRCAVLDFFQGNR